MSDTSQNFDLVPINLAVKAMRDNGYKSAAYAIAELIDNSIQAGASQVELLCCETESFVKQRVRKSVNQIAVLDNGSGMNAAVLRIALQFGNGTHLNDRTGIGRFGMGLPSASISQCKRVEVWSWQHGVESANYSYIDLDDVIRGAMREVPQPEPKAVPELWLAAADEVGESGTLVVWSQIDRCMWRTAKAVIENSEFIIGRMYRKQLSDGRVSIRLAAFTTDRPDRSYIDDRAAVNDPGYLMAPSSTPAPYDTMPMFEVDGDTWEIPHKISYKEQSHTVLIRISYAKKEARAGTNPGALPHGKHAAKNIGVSLMRADRELEMDQSLVVGYDPTERWWGIEIDFPPELDELFGVTNNKQTARNFSELALSYKNQVGDGTRQSEAEKDLADEDEDPTAPILDLIRTVDRRLKTLRKIVKLSTKGSGQAKPGRYDNSAESRATEATKERQQRGYEGRSDADEQLPDAQRIEQLASDYIESGYDVDDAQGIAARTINTGMKYTFATASLEAGSFFTVRPVAGEIVVKINIDHPAYKNLVEVLDHEIDPEAQADDLRDRLNLARNGLRLLLMAWARLEDEQINDARRDELAEIRQDWGRVAARFLRDV